MYCLKKTSFDETCKFRKDVGTWSSGIPATMNLKPEMEDTIVQHSPKKVLRVVTLVQHPFIQWNYTTSNV